MKCPNCQNEMTSDIDTLGTVTVTHSCLHCQECHSLEFANGNSSKKEVPSKVGHVLSYRYNGGRAMLPIIGQYSKNGLVSYVLAQWNEASKSFIEKREDSYIFTDGGGHISKDAMQLSEAHKAMSRAFALQVELKAAKQTIRMIYAQGGEVYTMALNPVTLPRRRFEMDDKTTYEMQYGEAEFIEIDSEALQAAKDRYEALKAAFLEEMGNAGIELK